MSPADETIIMHVPLTDRPDLVEYFERDFRPGGRGRINGTAVTAVSAVLLGDEALVTWAVVTDA